MESYWRRRIHFKTSYRHGDVIIKTHSLLPTCDLAYKLIAEQFPEFSNLPLTEVEMQGHDNRTFRLGNHLLVRMPISSEYAEKVAIEQNLLPKIAKHITLNIPVPLKMGRPSKLYPFPFSIYKWLPGKSLNLRSLSEKAHEFIRGMRASPSCFDSICMLNSKN